MPDLPLHRTPGTKPVAQQEVTTLLRAWSDGDPQAFDRLAPLLYDELHRLAQHYMRNERSRQELQTTALLHEAYLRLADCELTWKDRRHFLGAAASVMRRVLIDTARKRDAEKRGGGVQALALDQVSVAEQPAWYLLELDQALRDLESFDTRKARIVELRYFGGLSIAETGETLGLSRSTVDRELKLAKAWLRTQIRR